MIKSKLNITSILLLLFAFTIPASLQAQISYGGEPYSFRTAIKTESPVIQLQSIDKESINVVDEERDAMGELYRVGVGIQTNINLYEHGNWEKLENGNRLWRLSIESDGAAALGLYLSNFWIPAGCELFVYNEDHSKVLGSYTYFNNPSSGLFAIEPVFGDKITLELFEPYYAKNEASFKIHEVAYMYRGYNAPTRGGQYNSSQECEVDAVCSEANDWRPQQRSVAKILVKSGSDYGFCTGSLVNNTENNCLPYFLTADHCADGASFDDVLQWVFYFKYERSSCNLSSESEPSYISISGAQRRARGANQAGSKSDFYLVIFNTYLPASVDAYFNGWRNSNTASGSGVGIHHPSGDVKKISTFTATTTNYYTTHWSVGWASTSNGWGVTEGGSSGSPIFNAQGYLMGTLTGGLSACTNGGAGTGTGPTQKDIYGKFSYHWASNGTSADYRLKDWLDPNNESPTIWEGRENDCESYPVIADFFVETNIIPVGTTVEFKNLSLYHPDNGCSFLWEFEGVVQSATSIFNNPSRTFNTDGIYQVKLTATSNGETSVKIVEMYVGNIGIDETNLSEISLYPNPAKDLVHLEFGQLISSSVFVEIIDMMGKQVHIKTYASSTQEILIDTRNFATGIYQVRIIGDNFDESRKISIVK